MKQEWIKLKVFIYLGRWIVNYVPDYRGTRKTTNTHNFVILVW